MLNRKIRGARWIAGSALIVLILPVFVSVGLPQFAAGRLGMEDRIVLTARPQLSSDKSLPLGDADRGKELFMGDLHFQNGGPPCMGCHNIGSNGILGGGVLGPDLTNVSKRRSEADLAALLANPSQTMQPIFSEHPLTSQEQADLLAFLAASAGQPETNREWTVIGISLVGFIAAAALAQIVYRRRLHGVRKSLVSKARSVNSRKN